MENHYLYLGPKYKEAINAFNDYLGNSSTIVKLDTKTTEFFDKEKSHLISLIKQASSQNQADDAQALIRKKKELDRKNNKEIQSEITSILEKMKSVDDRSDEH